MSTPKLFQENRQYQLGIKQKLARYTFSAITCMGITKVSVNYAQTALRITLPSG